MATLIEQNLGNAKNYVDDYPVSNDHEASFHYGHADPAKGIKLTRLLELGDMTVAKLKLTNQDRVCLPLSLNHQMGMGFGVLSALSAGSRVVLPSEEDENDTMKTMTEEKCSILFADSHTYKDLPCGSTQWARCGVLKVGSGDDFNNANADHKWGNVSFLSVGVPR